VELLSPTATRDRVGERQSAAALGREKLLGIEIIRFVSAFAVLCWHYQHFAYEGETAVRLVRTQEPFYGLFGLFYEYGLLAVQVFWCTSGFIFFYKYRDSIADHEVGGRQFFILRLSRLYPLHLATLLIVAVLEAVFHHRSGSYFVYMSNDLSHFVAQLFMASYWGFIDGDSFNGPSWSVSVEVLVYFIFFTVLRYIGKSISMHLTILAASVAMVFAFAAMGADAYALPECLFFYFLGGLVAIFLRKSTSMSRQRQSAVHGVAWIIALAIPFIACLNGPPVLTAHSAILVLAVWLPPVLYCGARVSFANRTVQKTIEAAGNMTYSSYLIQFPIQLGIMIGFTYLRRAVPMYDPRFWAVYVLSTLTLSFFVYKYFERPAQSGVRRKLLSAHPAASPEMERDCVSQANS
jgi:peptidoglycan/LPS O-acetylase OafA/YrhL